MRVLHVAAEVFPLVKTGGLADVAAALPPAIARCGIDTRLLLPGLPGILAGVSRTETVQRIGPAFGAAVVTLLRARLPDSGLTVYVIDAPFLYRRDGNPYLAPDGRDWSDNHRRFALLGWTAAHLAAGELDADWTPDIVHAHDWHAALVPAYLRQNPALRTATVFTIHNLAFRGLFPLECQSELGLPARKLTPQGMEFHGQLSFIKAGLVYSRRLTTVSPTYAREICTPEHGWGLDGVLRDRGGDLSGILNGVDDQVWNPAKDPTLARRFDRNRLAGKAECKRALQHTCGLALDAEAPLFAVVSRLTTQKGIDLLLDALPALIADGAQIAVLGTGDAGLEARWRAAAAAHPDRVAVHIAHDETLSHQTIAGADLLLMPSRFEPCGLTQLYALRYGTVPLVRRVGGLADTVVDVQPATLKSGSATGFVFADATAGALVQRIRDACTAFADRRQWRQLQKQAMAQDFSWTSAAERYADLYRELIG